MSERFTIEKRYRRARRGAADVVHDGWWLTDTVLGARRAHATKGDAVANALRIGDREEALRQRLADGPTPIGWHASDGDNAHNGGLREVYLILPEGETGTHRLWRRPAMFAGLAARGSLEADVAAVLALYGLPADLPRVTS